MTTSFSDADRAALAAAAAGAVRVHWPSATSAGDASRVAKLWDVAVEQGWFELAAHGELASAFAIVRELGRLACPFPVLDGYVAASLAGSGSELMRRVADGSLRVVVATGDGETARFVECATAATHALLVAEDDSTARLHEIVDVQPASGIALPAWSDVRVAQGEVISTDARRVAIARAVLRLGLMSRATAAAERAHEIAVEHAKTRVQFGRVIGAFGAVQQRTATAQIDVSASRSLIGHAIAALTSDGDPAELPVALAVEFAGAAATRVQLAAQHTLAASGYFEETEGPWLFRRVHADVTRAALFGRPGESAGDLLVERELPLPGITTDDPAAAELRTELHELFREHLTPGRDPEEARLALRDAMVARGHFGMGWPAEHGGRSASIAEQVVLSDEIQYCRAPVRAEMSTVMLLGGAIMRHGTPAQRSEFLPRIRRGEIRFCLGYSEPEVGSDLASLATRATHDGDDWVINGQKAWTTNAHIATHVWLACRTNPAAHPRHAGITVFLIPMDTPGITVQQHVGLSGEISCSVFYDDVRVPDSARVGAVDGGWQVIIDALAGERVVMGSVAAVLRRQLDEVLAVVRRDVIGRVGPRGSHRRARLGRLGAQVQATRALVANGVAATSVGSTNLDAPMAAVLGGEVAEEFGETLLELFGPEIAVAGGAGWPADVEQFLRLSVMYVVGGGTNDVQRGMIARALGLPR